MMLQTVLKIKNPFARSRTTKGFTLIELLIVITIIGILAGIVLSIMNAPLFKNKAKDSVRQTNIKKLSSGINAHFASTGLLPQDTNSDGNPTNDGTGAENHISNWPLDAIYEYAEYPNYTYCISVPMATDPSSYYKFVSKPIGTNNPECTSLIVLDCDSSCLTNSELNCTKANGSAC